MSELIILAKIIWDWKQCLSTYRKSAHCQTCNFMLAADVWIVINLVLAIIMSIPAANIFTHGTHITVAHAMGTTIGINTMILLASVFFVLEKGFRGQPFEASGQGCDGGLLAGQSLAVRLFRRTCLGRVFAGHSG